VLVQVHLDKLAQGLAQQRALLQAHLIRVASQAQEAHFADLFFVPRWIWGGHLPRRWSETTEDHS
jgi:hypothetical protein